MVFEAVLCSEVAYFAFYFGRLPVQERIVDKSLVIVIENVLSNLGARIRADRLQFI